MKFTVCHVKTKKWLEKSSTIKEKEDFLLTKTHKLTSFFQVVEKEAGHSSDDLHSNFPPISFQLNTVQAEAGLGGAVGAARGRGQQIQAVEFALLHMFFSMSFYLSKSWHYV